MERPAKALSPSDVRMMLHLMTILSRRADNRACFASEGGIGVVLQSMRVHPTDASIQQQGCAALWNLVVKSAENRVRVASQGGIELLLTALCNFKSQQDLQRLGTGVLDSLSTDGEATMHSSGCNVHPSSLPCTDRCCDQLVQCGGVAIVIETVNRFLDDEKILQTACRTLANVLLSGKVRSSWCWLPQYLPRWRLQTTTVPDIKRKPHDALSQCCRSVLQWEIGVESQPQKQAHCLRQLFVTTVCGHYGNDIAVGCLMVVVCSTPARLLARTRHQRVDCGAAPYRSTANRNQLTHGGIRSSTRCM